MAEPAAAPPDEPGAREALAEGRTIRTADSVRDEASPQAEMTKSRSVPTIPSRYAVTLIKGNREYKGFNSRSMRFEGRPPVEAPGPGSYGQQKAFHQEFTERPSWGVRGTGGFASKTRRFNIRVSLPAGLGCPGPGAYNALGALRFTKEAQDFSQASASASFNPKKSSPRAVPRGELPGPGQYEPKLLSSQSEAAGASFRSTSLRLDRVPDALEPGPGDYHDGLVRPVGYIPEHSLGLDMRMPTFKDRSTPHITKVHRDLPPASAKARGLLGEFANEVSRECLGSRGMALAMPGPGQYQDIARSNPVSGAAHSAFQAGPKRTDFSAQDGAGVPGPGRYEPRKVPSATSCPRTIKSAFESTSDRGKLQVTSAPGPAYYSPSLPRPQKSFRLKTSDFVA
mmetsp:Transcript_8366/g.15236  ORF Transcript_8366/g.15236 Transcript_8366/m.15236 type:complete len:397 (+) Transcript_8366:36-1226(+)